MDLYIKQSRRSEDSVCKCQTIKHMIILDDKFRIEEDAYSWNLVERTSPACDRDKNPKLDESGKQLWNEEISYHANLKQALVNYLDRAVRGSEDALGILEALRTAEQNIEKALEER